MKITKSKLRKLITEERNTAKEYRKYGFKGPAKDEARHSKYFKKKLRYLK